MDGEVQVEDVVKTRVEEGALRVMGKVMYRRIYLQVGSTRWLSRISFSLEISCFMGSSGRAESMRDMGA